MSFLDYKSGTDIRFTAITTEQSTANINAPVLAAMARAFAVFLSRRTGYDSLKIGVGHDSRISADEIFTTVADALTSCGCHVLDCGLCSTPSMFNMTQYPSVKADGSIMITASHHPFDKNGLKFFTPDGGLEGCDVEEILNLAERGESLAAKKGKLTRKNYMVLYEETLINHVRNETGKREPLKGLRVVVDAGNGAGGFFAKRVLAPLGADTSGSQFLDPNGRFPNHIPNPENRDAMHAISECVKKNRADLGIIFDTDVDRAAVVASDGQEINRNRLIALLSAIVLEETPRATIVTDSVTSDGLGAFIEAHGGVHRRFKRGYKNVIDEAIRLEKTGVAVPLAIETSGHAALRENFFLDDGAYVVIKLLITMCRLREKSKTLFDLIKDLKEPIEEEEIRLSYTVENWKQAGEAVLQRLRQTCEARPDLKVAADSCEGVRVSTPQGFFLVRMSVHDPNIPVNFEASEKGGVKTLQRELLSLLKKETVLNLEKLEAAVLE